ncbi:zinc finger CCCH domain-containing protein 41 [Dorcoceras hygrometricum]|uniref:Zinc finger CCCH domain-containing protein 41 n=1 Tax=Dorcoceras hygrometricum TaxID=472368 RepID=A0A2Z7C9J3_9LAMI|nr:zinc finger CCCH domain-containing protein 41 [Dorcoceras hygrometricum]
MDVRVSSQNIGFLASTLLVDTEKKETSEGEDEDVDRNHKHRKRAAHSQSFNGDSLDQFFIRPYRKRSKPFENGSDKGNDMISGRELLSRFERRVANQDTFSGAHMDLNKRISQNQPLPREALAVRSRGKELGSWIPHDYRLGSVDFRSHFFPLGPVPSGLVAGRVLPNIATAQGLSWNAVGLLPGAPTGGLDALNSCGLQAALRPSNSPSVNIGIPRGHCRDFEELGFCLRGELCPMEHGVNRIIIDDVQGLSQFNLPQMIPDCQLLGASAGQGDSWGGGSDVYDPDQPLLTSDSAATTSLLSLNQSNADKTEPFLDMDSTDRPHVEPCEGFDELPVRSDPTSGPQSASVWRRIGNSNNISRVKEKKDTEENSPSFLEPDIRSEEALSAYLQDVSQWGKQVNLTDECRQVKGMSLKPYSNFARDAQKPSQKAVYTLFVNGIPWKDNKRESLFSHFQKFGEIIDIYIPMHSERAFVQFSKTEEAEAALRAPDAVMGNRFIKLRWANRDNIPNDKINNSGSLSTTSCGVALGLAFSHESPHSAGIKDGSIHMSVSQVQAYDHPSPVSYNGPKSSPLQQKRLENLELLKEELRKKQEMLDQKRNEFRRQLDKLEKQSTGSKTETARSSPRINALVENVKPAELALSHSSSTSTAVALEHPSLRSSGPACTPPAPSVANRFKLDNRPTAFKIVSPLPVGLADAATLEEHFNNYGDLSSVELEESHHAKVSNDDAPSACGVSARISFATRRSAEKAFINGKSWKGHPLQFTWLKSNTCRKASDAPGNPSARLKMAEVSATIISLNSAALPESITARSGDIESADLSKDSTSAD